MQRMTVSEAADQTGWSPRMLRYIERAGLVVPERTRAGYRLYGLRELNQLRSLAQLRRRFGVEIERGRVRRPAPRRSRAPRRAGDLARTDAGVAAGGVGAAQARTAPGRLKIH